MLPSDERQRDKYEASKLVMNSELSSAQMTLTGDFSCHLSPENLRLP